MHIPLRGRGTRHSDDVRRAFRRSQLRRIEPAHRSLRNEPRPVG